VLKRFNQISKLIAVLQIILADSLSFFAALLRSRTALVAENLFLRKQLALFQEREKKAKPTTAADRFVFAKLARLFNWRSALVIVQPATLTSWHRTALSSILALEVETSRSTSNLAPSCTPDPPYGGRKYNLGRRTNCR